MRCYRSGMACQFGRAEVLTPGDFTPTHHLIFMGFFRVLIRVIEGSTGNHIESSVPPESRKDQKLLRETHTALSSPQFCSTGRKGWRMEEQRSRNTCRPIFLAILLHRMEYYPEMERITTDTHKNLDAAQDYYV